MKISAYIFTSLLFFFSFTCFAQTADEIIEQYLEKSGGRANWENLNATKMIAEVENEGIKTNLTIYNTKDGKQALVVDYMGQKITQLAYDGEVLWITDSNMRPQMADEASTKNMKYSKNDFPNPFLNYKNNGYTVKFMGEENVNDTETYKILLKQKPVTIEGVEEESLMYYFFDTENYLPVMIETEVKGGPMDGQFSTSILENYKKVEGLFFPFSITENGQELQIKQVVLNPKIEDEIFAFPEE